jgi:hypothetical protein
LPTTPIFGKIAYWQNRRDRCRRRKIIPRLPVIAPVHLPTRTKPTWQNIATRRIEKAIAVD